MGKIVFSWMIKKDSKIPGTMVRTSTIPEQLGRISYLLTDKTGKQMAEMKAVSFSRLLRNEGLYKRFIIFTPTEVCRAISVFNKLLENGFEDIQPWRVCVKSSVLQLFVKRFWTFFFPSSGTLTQNEMVFRRLHLGTVAYGMDSMDEVQSHVFSAYTQVTHPGRREWDGPKNTTVIQRIPETEKENFG